MAAKQYGPARVRCLWRATRLRHAGPRLPDVRAAGRGAGGRRAPMADSVARGAGENGMRNSMASDFDCGIRDKLNQFLDAQRGGRVVFRNL